MKKLIRAFLVPFFLLVLTSAAMAEPLLFLRDNALWVCDTQGLQQRQLASLFKEPGEPALSPDGSLASLTAGRDMATGLSFLYLAPVDGSARARKVFISDVPGTCCPSFSPDGSSLLVVTAQDVRQGHMENTTLATMAVSRVSFSGGNEIVLENKDSLLDAGYVFSSPVYAPDGKHIAVQHSGSDVSGGFAVYDQKGEIVFRYPMDSKDHRPFWAPRFLPDGENILCWSPALDPSGASEISLVHMPDGKRTVIAQGSRPTLVDGGKAMVFERCASPWGGGCDLWRQDLRAGAPANRIVTDARAPAGRYPVLP